jgi:3-oxoacyl-[acyl-carrier protein] reductase
LSSGDAYAAALRAAAPTGISAVVDAGLLGQEPAAGELASLDPETWRRDAEQPLRRALHLMQGAHSCLAGEGGRIIVLLPSLVMSGAAGAVAWAAAAEGYRSLAKAAARAWGSSGISIKCVLVPAAVAVTSVADRPGLQPPAIGRLPDPGSDIAPAIVALLDSRLDTVTGVTVAVDGGVWMTS